MTKNTQVVICVKNCSRLICNEYLQWVWPHDTFCKETLKYLCSQDCPLCKPFEHRNVEVIIVLFSNVVSGRWVFLGQLPPHISVTLHANNK